VVPRGVKIYRQDPFPVPPDGRYDFPFRTPDVEFFFYFSRWRNGYATAFTIETAVLTRECSSDIAILLAGSKIGLKRLIPRLQKYIDGESVEK